MANKCNDNLKEIMGSVQKYVEIVKDKYKVETIILFGSYAKGTNHKDSDIDIAVVTDDFEGDKFDAQVKLGLLTWDVDVRIEPHLITVEDYKSIGNELVWEIINTGIKVA